MGKSKDPKPLQFSDKELDKHSKQGADREAKIDAEVSDRTSRFDQDLKERARNVGINPDNFAEEHVLGEAVTKAEAEKAEAEKESE